MPHVIAWNDSAVYELLNDYDGPVGQLLAELSQQVADVATAKVRVRDPADRRRSRRAGLHSSATPPGYTKANIRPHLGKGSLGGIYGGANAPGIPGIFLEYPARQMADKYPFLSTGLESLAI